MKVIILDVPLVVGKEVCRPLGTTRGISHTPMTGPPQMAGVLILPTADGRQHLTSGILRFAIHTSQRHRTYIYAGQFGQVYPLLITLIVSTVPSPSY